MARPISKRSFWSLAALALLASGCERKAQTLSSAATSSESRAVSDAPDACASGACAPAPFPELSSCKSDGDCVLSRYVAGACCPELCPPWSQSYTKRDVSALEAWRAQHCGESHECPMAKCAAPEADPVVSCVKGQCQVSPPAQGTGSSKETQ